MRGVALTVVLLASAAVAAGASSATTSKPALRLVDSSPLTVKGVAFKPGERVRVVVRFEDERLYDFVRANRRGTFVAAFEETSLRCGFTVQAFGTRGSRASLKLPQLACPPPLTPP